MTLTRTLPRISDRGPASFDPADDSPPTAGTRRRARPTGANRNTTRIGVGALVLVASVLGTLTVYSSAGDRTSVIALRRDVPAGRTVTAEDLREVGISVDSSLSTIRSEDAAKVVGKVATVPLRAGSLLSSGQVGDAPELAAGEALVGAVLKSGQYPSGLRVGATVRVVEVPVADAAGQIKPVGRGTARVADVAESSNDGSTVVVSLVVAGTDAENVASAGAAGRLSLVVEPAR